MRTKERSSQCRVPRASLLLTLTTIILFSCSQQSLAQQRDGNATNADSNSSSASTGRVNFNIIQLMNGEYLEMFGTGTGRGILRGHPTISGIELGSLSADPLIFSTNGIERMRIGSNGFVGIGTTNTVVPLEFYSPAATAYSPTSTQGARIRLINSDTALTANNVFEINLGAFDTTGQPSTRVRLASISTNHTSGAQSGDFAIGLRHNGTLFESARFTATGNFGIGVASPSAKLHVVGVAPWGTAAFMGTTWVSHFNYNGDNSEDTYIRGGKSTSRVLINDGHSGNVLIALGGGNVGLGTATPNRRLELFHDIAGIGFEAGTGSPDSGVIRFGDGSGWKLHFGRSRNGTALNSGTAGVLMTIQDNGNVGIGATAPGFKLDVNGEINATGFRISGTPISTGGSGAVSSVFGRTGAVVAATNDYTWAQINKSTSSLADIAIRSASDLSSGTLPNARFPTTLPAVSAANLTALNASNLASGTVPTARLGSGTADSTKFLRGDNTWAVPSGGSQWTTSGTSISYNSGNVGIGTGTAIPAAKLEVIGDIKVSGNINAKYQDVAEWVDSSQELVAGTVVVLDSSRSNHVIAATQSYDSRIAGVISLQPGLTLGEEAEGRVLVATTGRVRVKVDATEGAIQIGDLLVTSNREGFAMKSLPVDVGGVRMHRPGTLIGKALEPLAKGTGEILVLLSLQ